jgi:hypothetical protein
MSVVQIVLLGALGWLLSCGCTVLFIRALTR